MCLTVCFSSSFSVLKKTYSSISPASNASLAPPSVAGSLTAAGFRSLSFSSTHLVIRSAGVSNLADSKICSLEIRTLISSVIFPVFGSTL